jgi:hypothetical protein
MEQREGMPEHREVWHRKDDGRALCALIHSERGWLMYLPGLEDTGYSSRDPDYSGDPGAKMEFVLSNGQRDEYPVAWTLPLERIERAFRYFDETGDRAPFIEWHAD